jgi:maltooligosyltrehalose trehalohydrolase
MARAVSEGRKKEFAAFGFGDQQIPDPEARETFERSKLDWTEPGEGQHAEMFRWVSSLIHLRRKSVSLNDGDLGHMSVDYDEAKRWLAMDRGGVRVALNLGEEAVSFDVSEGFRVVLTSRDGIGAAEGTISLPPDTLAVLSNESE